MTAFYAYLFNTTISHDLGLEPAIEIHSRKSQTQRTRSSEKFRNSQSAVLFSSDVSARGVDYPDVTHVLQFGLPPSTDQYIHRLGRTGKKLERPFVVPSSCRMFQYGLRIGPVLLRVGIAVVHRSNSLFPKHASL